MNMQRWKDTNKPTSKFLCDSSVGLLSINKFRLLKSAPNQIYVFKTVSCILSSTTANGIAVRMKAAAS